MTRLRVAVLISGSGSNMVALLDSMTDDHPARPVLVLGDSEKATGLALAAKRGVATAMVKRTAFGPDRVGFEHEMHRVLNSAGADILCLAGFMRVLSADFVSRWGDGILNIHPSLLPKYKGLNTHARAIAAGDDVHGCTVHRVTAALDDGPVLGQARVPIKSGDTPQTLAARVLKMEHRLYPAVLHRFASGDPAPLFLP